MIEALARRRRRRDLAVAWERIRAAERHGAEANLCGLDLTGADFRGKTLSRVVFGDHENGDPPALLAGARFRRAQLTRCRFAHCDLDRVEFKHARLEHCDLRYAVARSGSFEDAELRSCDLYRAAFEGGTVFERVCLVEASLDHARLDGMLGLTPSAFGARDRERRLVQEDEETYERFLRAGPWIQGKDEAYADSDLEGALECRLFDAATIYRRLSGMWSAQGEFRYAGWAYRRARMLERRSIGPFHGRTPLRPFTWLALCVVGAVSGFGERPLRVLVTGLLVVLGPAALYRVLNGVETEGRVTHDVGDVLLFSLGQVTTTAPDRLEPASRLAELGGELQTLTGIVLLGLLGFVLGNRIRMS